MLKVINSIINYVKGRRVYNKTYRELAALSDRELEDIGINRYDIHSVAVTHLVKQPKTANNGSLMTAMVNARLVLH